MTEEATETRFTVLVSTDHGVNWRRHAGIIATGTEQAINRVRKADADLLGNPDALYYATSRFAARKMGKQLVEKWSMQTLDPAEPLPGDAAEEVNELDAEQQAAHDAQ